ncbi:MAG: hypothetical protein ACK4YF_04840 [Exilispira sp.]
MNNFFLILTILFIPIFILLFVRQIKRKKIFYSFIFLRRFRSKSFKQILLKILQLFYDIIFDILIAIVLTMIFSNILISFNFSNKVAIVLDSSYSMMKVDSDGNTPFEKAVMYYYTHKNEYKSYDLYAAAFDINRSKSKIININKMKKIINPKMFIDQFLKEFTIFEFDLNLLSDRKLTGYKKIIFLTDFFPYNISKNKIDLLEVFEFGKVEKDFFYPVSIIYQPASDNIYCFFIKSKQNYLPEVKIYDKNKFFINADDKVKLSFNNENSIILETKEKSLFKVSLFNQSYYIDLTSISFIIESSGDYSNIIKSVLLSSFNIENDLMKLEQRGFKIEKSFLPILSIYQGELNKSFLKKIEKEKNIKKLVYNLNITQKNIDLIIDSKYLAGSLLSTSENGLKEIYNNVRKQKLEIINSPLSKNIPEKNIVFYPISISDKFLLKPQTIIYFYMFTKLFEESLKPYELLPVLNNKNITIKNANIIEKNNTSILYKVKDKLIYKNISIDEIYQYKNFQNFNIKNKNNSRIIYLLILTVLFLSKSITFIILKSK